MDAHAVLKADHKVRALKDFETEDYENFLQSPMLCSEKFHESQPLVFYCNNCQMCLCQLCVVSKQKMHSEHEIIPLDEAAEIKKASFLTDIKNLEKKKGLLDKAVQEMDKVTGEIDENFDSAKAEVNEYSELLIANIRQQRDALLAELEKVREEEHEQINSAFLEFW